MKRQRDNDGNGFEQWGGYMNAKITKLEQQFDEDANQSKSDRLSNIFEGISIFVNGYTNPSAEELKLLMKLHGGIYHHYERIWTYCVIASNLPNAKMKLLKNTKFIKPEWITESIAAAKLLDYKDYSLYTNQSTCQPQLNFTKSEKVASPLKVQLDSEPGFKVAKTATDSKFLSEFYNNSRLHHIATMGAMFKQYVSDLRMNHTGVYSGRNRLVKWKKLQSIEKLNVYNEKPHVPVIMHIDMDCFFVSVALRNHPELKGHPLAVTHAKGNPTHQRAGVDRQYEFNHYKKLWNSKMKKGERNSSSSDEDPIDAKKWTEAHSMSEIASCSYEAREMGVKNGMLLGTALKLCPKLKTVSYDFEGYKEVSFCLYNTVAEFCLDIEAVSCDELFVDCTQLLAETGTNPLEFAQFLRNEIKELTRCPASAGMGSNKLQARLATKKAKPDGQFYLEAEHVKDFMNDVLVESLPGVGYRASSKLKSLGAKTCGELQNISLNVLQKEFGGKTGETLYKYCRGKDERNVNSSHQRKSVSAEVNYGIRFTTNDEAITFFKQLSEEVSSRLKEIKMKGRALTFKLMVRAQNAPVETAKFLGHGICDYITKSSPLPTLTDDASVIVKNVINLYQQLKIEPSELRGIGIQISKLDNVKSSGGLHSFLKPVHEIVQSAPKITPKPVANEKQKLGIMANFIKKEEPSENKAGTSKEVRKMVENKVTNIPSFQELDRDVIAALPEEIQAEILAQYSLKKEDLFSKTPRSTNFQSSTPLTLSQIDPNVLEELPKDIQLEIKGNLEVKEKVSSSNNLQHNENVDTLQETLTTNELRQLIGEWVATEKIPQQCDIDMVSDYIQTLIKDKKDLETADIIIKCLHRHITKIVVTVPIWRSVYYSVVEQVQTTMIDIYKAKLKVEDI